MGDSADQIREHTEELHDEIERLSFRQLTLYNAAGEEVFTMTIGPRGSRWKAAEGGYIAEVARVEIE